MECARPNCTLVLVYVILFKFLKQQRTVTWRVRHCQVMHLLSRAKYGSFHPNGVLILDESVSWHWALLMPWFIYVAVCLLLYIVRGGSAAGLLAFCATFTFVTIVVTNGHRISDDNRSVCLSTVHVIAVQFSLSVIILLIIIIIIK